IWPEMKVTVTSVTDEWAGAAIGGPKARAILSSCVTGTAVDNATLPFMGIVRGQIAGVPVMMCRLSFSGEIAFEVYSGAGHGTRVSEALIEAGKPFGLVTYGLEALGKARHGTRAFVSDPLRKRFGPIEIVSNHFYDPDGSRMHG